MAGMESQITIDASGFYHYFFRISCTYVFTIV